MQQVGKQRANNYVLKFCRLWGDAAAGGGVCNRWARLQTLEALRHVTELNWLANTGGSPMQAQGSAASVTIVCGRSHWQAVLVQCASIILLLAFCVVCRAAPAGQRAHAGGQAFQGSGGAAGSPRGGEAPGKLLRL